jgi:hypothetical protein
MGDKPMKRLLAVLTLFLFLIPTSCDQGVTEPEVQSPEIQPPEFAVKGKTGEIVYTSGTASANNLFLMDVSTKTVTNLTSGMGGLNQMPEWSPDGQAVLFSASPSGDFNQLEIYLGWWPAGGSFSAFQLIYPPCPGPKLFPTWSPDGNGIAFICGGNGGWGHLWVATYNGFAWIAGPVTAGPLKGSRPTWWGNDKIIMPTLQPGPGGSMQRDLWWTSFPPTPATQGTLTNTPLKHEDNPWWRNVTGSGDDLVYNVVTDLGDPTEASDIFTARLGVDASGNPVLSTPTKLTKSGTADYPSWTPSGDAILYVELAGLPSWTPSGDAILYVELAGLDREVFQMEPTGAKKKNLTNSPAIWELWAKRRPPTGP